MSDEIGSGSGDTTPAAAIERAHRSAGGTWWPGAHDHAAVARHILQALEADGFAVVRGLTPEWTVESRWGVEEHNISENYTYAAGIAESRNLHDLPTKILRRLVGPWETS
jgi:hypothetical protein